MTISLGRRFPDASSGLPGGRPGRVTRRSGRPRRAAEPLPPYLALLPVGFTEPGRSPDLLVSSYLTVSPLPRELLRVAVYFLWHCPYPDEPGGGRYPPPIPVESGLSSEANASTARKPPRLPRRSSRLSRPVSIIASMGLRRTNTFPGRLPIRTALRGEVVGRKPSPHRVFSHAPSEQKLP